MSLRERLTDVYKRDTADALQDLQVAVGISAVGLLITVVLVHIFPSISDVLNLIWELD